MLLGYRTYLIAALIGLTQASSVLGWITPEMTTTLTNLLVGGGLFFLRAGVANK